METGDNSNGIVADTSDSISNSSSFSGCSTDPGIANGDSLEANPDAPVIDQNQNCTTLLSPSGGGVKSKSMEGEGDGKTTQKERMQDHKEMKACKINGSSESSNGEGEGSPKGKAQTEEAPSEEELLRRLEEANRMLEADEKSHHALVAFSTTPGHSRKGSGSSIVSSASSNSFYSAQVSNDAEDQNGNSTESLWEIWGRIINDWETVKKKPAFLRDLVRKGIPHEFRGMAWQLILGVHDSAWKQEYAEHMKKTSPCEKLIRRDIARTFPDHDFFKEKDGFGQESLFNVMKAYSLHDREVGYCQGSGFIVGLLLMQMPEEDAFAVLVRLMQDFRLRELFKPSMAELGLCMYKLECLIQELLPTLLVHFQTQNFDTSMYASSWFLTLYVTSLPLSLARRIMDLFVSEGMEMIFRVGVAILQSCQEDLLALDMEGLLMYLQKDLRSRFEQEIDQENLLQTAYGIKYSHKKMKKLEKEYTALKTKENEDQIELRRLRTENRLLRQRIENLEKVEAKLLRQNEESATLADKLVQDQVTWAQEVEQSYALKNELSVTRQQLNETQKKLLDAEDIIGDIRKRTRIIEDAVHLDESEERNMVKHLQEELIAVRLREAETAGTIKELKQKISDLEDTNLRLQRAPSNDVQQLQEELIAVKLREAEANLSLKELKMKVNEIESYWEAHMERVRQNSPKEKNSKTELRHLQEETMALKLKEARAVADVKDAKQKLMELETQNQICTNQIRRMGDENKELKQQLEEAAEREKDLKTNIKDLTRKLDDTETKRREEGMMARIREAEMDQQLAELRQKIAEIDIQKEELLVAGQLHNKGDGQDLEKVHALQDEVLRLQMSNSPRTPIRNPKSLMTDSFMGNDSDEEFDADIKDSENLDKTLSDIIEGKGYTSSGNSIRDLDNSSLAAAQSSDSLTKANNEENSVSGLNLMEGDCVNSGNTNDKHSSQVGAGTELSGTGGLESRGEKNNINPSADALNSSRSSEGAKDSADLPTNSGESNVIDACDLSQRESTDIPSDDKGKSCWPLGNLPPSAVESSVQAESSRTNADILTPKRKSSGKSKDSVQKTFNPNVADPNQNFPEDWELYEEVVMVDTNMEAKVVSRNSSDRENWKAAGLRGSVERAGNSGINSGGRNSVERGLQVSSKFTPGSVVHSKSIKPRKDKATRSSVNASQRRSVERSQSREKSDVSGHGIWEGFGGRKEEEIPDVVVIYEPSCGSLLCGRDEDDDDKDFVLKESTV